MLTEDQIFDKIDFTQKLLPIGDYEYCTFKNCNFSGTDLSGTRFLECVFDGCNISLAKLVKTSFKDIKFKDCKLAGLLFEDCDTFNFSVSFATCILNHSSFYAMKLKKTVCKKSELHEVDFTDADLSSSVFTDCDFLRATFNNTNLEKADFRTSFHYSIDVEKNRIKKAKFSLSAITGLLDKYDIEIDNKS